MKIRKVRSLSMRKPLVVVMMLIAMLSEAQKSVDDVVEDYMKTAGDHSALFQGRIEPNFNAVTWTDHPYWGDDQFHEGEIFFGGRLYKGVMMRYNMLERAVVVLAPERHLFVMPDADKISYFTIGDKRFVKMDGRYVSVEYDGRNVALVCDMRKTNIGNVIVDDRVFHGISEVRNYYLLYDDGSKVEVGSMKDVCNQYEPYKKELRRYGRRNNLSRRRSERAMTLPVIVKHLDSTLGDNNGRQRIVDGYVERTVDAMRQDMMADTARREVPREVYEEVSDAESVIAYTAYSEGGKVQYDYFEDYYSSETPGIDDLDPIRETHTLNEVEIVGFAQKVSSMQAGLESFRPQAVKNIPLAMGESDVMKVTMMLPGVNSTGEASSGINVRGGSTDQNLMLYNGNTIFYPMHMFGLFSAFNSDMIAETELFKGGIPSQYGGRLSSVMNIKGRTASKEQWHGAASVGLLTTKATLEIPVVRDKASMMISGRTTYSDWILKLLKKDEYEDGAMSDEVDGYSNGKAGFRDLGATIASKMGTKNSLTLSGYVSRDRFSLTETNKYKYANTNMSATVRTLFSENLTTNISAGYDNFSYDNIEGSSIYSLSKLEFDLKQYFLRGNIIYMLNGNHTIKGGLHAQAYDIMPGKYSAEGFLSEVAPSQLDDDKAIETAAYAEDTWDVNGNLKINGGMRLNLFDGKREGKEKRYTDPDVRLSASYTIDETNSVKMGFNTNHQYIHKVSNTVIMSPTDIWMLSNSKIKPQSGYQVSAGYYWQTKDREYEVSGELYYKGMKNFLTYRAGSQLVMNNAIENDVVPADGRAYGLELQLRKLSGKFNGWISYTYSRTQLQQTGKGGHVAINDGKWFAADYDTPNSLKVVANYKITHRYSLSVNADYSSGRPYTSPVGKFFDEGQHTFVAVYSERNACRMPHYFRMDMSFNIEPNHKLTQKAHGWFTLGVYNILGRKNAYSIFSRGDMYDIKTYKLSIFGAPIPFVTYNIKF